MKKMSANKANPEQDGKLKRNVYTLGLVSLFTDISSQMIHPLLPVFLTSVLEWNPEKSVK